jgi:flavin-dependent dehydrogenase
VGASPAGLTAACQAARADLATSLLPLAPAQPEPTLDWLGPAGLQLFERIGLGKAAVELYPFRGACLRSWNLEQAAQVSDEDLRGAIVARPQLVAALSELAAAAGVETCAPHRPTEVTLGEQCVTVACGPALNIQARLLIIADGALSATAPLARMPTAAQVEQVAACATVLLEENAADAAVDIIIGASRTPRSVTILRAGGQCQVSLITTSGGNAAEQALREFLAAARERNVLSGRDKNPVQTSLLPAGGALEMETLVGKRCLLIGEAGGFVAAFSGERLYPEMSSGAAAAAAVGEALQAEVLQDALLGFSTAWRGELAEYLRLPNTDLALLMPLVFSNSQMSARVTRAFLLGTTF